MTTFKVSVDLDYGHVVHDAGCRAYSMILVPVDYRWSFFELKDAIEQAERLTKLAAEGQIVKTRMIETPDRFEAVQDTKYGCAWT